MLPTGTAGRYSRVGISLDVYDRRAPIYRTTIRFVRAVVKDLQPGIREILQFATDTDEALFLFDETIAAYLAELFKKALRLHAIGLMLTQVQADQDTPSLRFASYLERLAVQGAGEGTKSWRAPSWTRKFSRCFDRSQT